MNRERNVYFETSIVTVHRCSSVHQVMVGINLTNKKRGIILERQARQQRVADE
jgi:hypothetical protein